jgi:hypothetical protein
MEQKQKLQIRSVIVLASKEGNVQIPSALLQDYKEYFVTSKEGCTIRCPSATTIHVDCQRGTASCYRPDNGQVEYSRYGGSDLPQKLAGQNRWMKSSSTQPPSLLSYTSPRVRHSPVGWSRVEPIWPDEKSFSVYSWKESGTVGTERHSLDDILESRSLSFTRSILITTFLRSIIWRPHLCIIV